MERQPTSDAQASDAAESPKEKASHDGATDQQAGVKNAERGEGQSYMNANDGAKEPVRRGVAAAVIEQSTIEEKEKKKGDIDDNHDLKVSQSDKPVAESNHVGESDEATKLREVANTPDSSKGADVADAVNAAQESQRNGEPKTLVQANCKNDAKPLSLNDAEELDLPSTSSVPEPVRKKPDEVASKPSLEDVDPQSADPAQRLKEAEPSAKESKTDLESSAVGHGASVQPVTAEEVAPSDETSTKLVPQYHANEELNPNAAPSSAAGDVPKVSENPDTDVEMTDVPETAVVCSKPAPASPMDISKPDSQSASLSKNLTAKQSATAENETKADNQTTLSPVVDSTKIKSSPPNAKNSEASAAAVSAMNEPSIPVSEEQAPAQQYEKPPLAKPSQTVPSGPSAGPSSIVSNSSVPLAAPCPPTAASTPGATPPVVPAAPAPTSAAPTPAHSALSEASVGQSSALSSGDVPMREPSPSPAPRAPSPSPGGNVQSASSALAPSASPSLSPSPANIPATPSAASLGVHAPPRASVSAGSSAPSSSSIAVSVSAARPPVAGPAVGHARPPLAGIPAAKRSRLSGTLDAAGTGGADLSIETMDRYHACASDVGVRLIARASAEVPASGNPRKDFLDDHGRYMREIDKGDFKVRTIGGNKLDLYVLYKSVLERGGVQAVITSRTFRLVARALDLPRSCTSAAFILRSEYEKILYLYEQKHVWNRDPQSVPALTSLERGTRPPPDVLKYASSRGSTSVANSSPEVSGSVATPAKASERQPAATPMSSSRPKRQAALAASSAVAAAVSDDPYGPSTTPRRTRTSGLDESSLTGTEEQIVEDEIANDNTPHSVYVPGSQAERERVIAALWSPVHDDVAWALGTLNALSFDARNMFQARSFTGILDALFEILHRHLEDVQCVREYGLARGLEDLHRGAPRVVDMPAVDIDSAGDPLCHDGTGLSQKPEHKAVLRSATLQQYATIFNVVDTVAVDREQCAVVAVNILRNMSFSDRNAIFISENSHFLELTAEIIMNAQVPANLRDGLFDMWINISPYLNVSKGFPGHVVLTSCIKLLDPFLEGADLSRFTNCGEVLARLAASPERNEAAFMSEFGDLLPRLVDMLGGKDRRYVNAGLAALCNCSAFDWPARSRIARVPRALPRLINMLSDPELAPRAALTLLNLAEAPSNRAVLLSYEYQLVNHAITVSPASQTISSVLFELSDY